MAAHCWPFRVFVGAQNPANAQTALRLGVLDCDISAGVGLIFTEKQTMSCLYKPDNGGVADRYNGKIEEVGIELGVTTGGVLTWVVLSAQKGVPQGALAGTYVGLSADASLGAGVGANASMAASSGPSSCSPIRSRRRRA